MDRRVLVVYVHLRILCLSPMYADRDPTLEYSYSSSVLFFFFSLFLLALPR